ncbi:hypothetical protein HY637_05975 [Candidatus Woesearchaeota archaeon]|nr:hypothetical protein [Candidatus Woesearchaeota archaeon]
MVIKKIIVTIFFVFVIFVSSCALNNRYYNDPFYCEKNSDCVIMLDACGSYVINKYNYDEKKEAENLRKSPYVECNEFIEEINPRCEDNKCVADENKLQ